MSSGLSLGAVAIGLMAGDASYTISSGLTLAREGPPDFKMKHSALQTMRIVLAFSGEISPAIGSLDRGERGETERQTDHLPKHHLWVPVVLILRAADRVDVVIVVVIQIPKRLVLLAGAVELPRKRQRIHRAAWADARAALPAGNADNEECFDDIRVQDRMVPALQRAPVVRDGNAFAVSERLDEAHDVRTDLDGGVVLDAHRSGAVPESTEARHSHMVA